MNEKNYPLITFTEDGLSLDVRVDAEKETVWLTQTEMAELFCVDRTRITRHVNNVLRDDEVDFESNVRKTHFANADRQTALYGLDMILSVGYRVNSKRGIAFRRWANTVLKQYLIEGGNHLILAIMASNVAMEWPLLAKKNKQISPEAP